MDIQELLGKIDIEENEIEKAKFYFVLKGINLHESIREYLQGFSVHKIRYSEIATAYRYDKKIRKVLYKYLGLFEENLRAYIANNYASELDTFPFVKQIAKKIAKKKKLFEVLDDILFSTLINQVVELSENDKIVLFPDTNYLQKNLKAIVRLRNAVSHNRFLIHYRDFKKCTIDASTSNSLHSNLINFGSYLKTDVKTEFINEINNCKYSSNHYRNQNKRRHQTKWVLLKDIIIKI